MTIYKYKFNVQGNYFNENFSGGRGTAIYVRQMSSVRIHSCTFVSNGPVFTVPEIWYSPYTRYLSSRAMTFYDDDCVDEFSYLEACYNSDDYASYGGIQWSKVQGAVYIQSCQEDYCINSNATQEIEITSSDFVKNTAGPVVDNQIVGTAS